MGNMAQAFVHTCLRVRDPEVTVSFYESLGFEKRGRLDFGPSYNLYMGLPNGGDILELTVNVGREEPYDLGDGYNHIAIAVDDIHATLEGLDVEPEAPPYRPGDREDLPLICFVHDPDGYRVELIDGGRFDTPQD
jgi:lactoylglutathione lyase